MCSFLSSAHLPSTLGAGYINTSTSAIFSKGTHYHSSTACTKLQHTEKRKQIKCDPWRGLCKSQQPKQAKVLDFYQAERTFIPTPLVPFLFYLHHLISGIRSLYSPRLHIPHRSPLPPASDAHKLCKSSVADTN